MYTFEFPKKRFLDLNSLALLQRISRKGFWAILDQGLFAFSNFIVSVFLARVLNSIEYGIFSTTLAIFYLQIVLHTSVLVEPMLVFGANKFQATLTDYQDTVIQLHWVFSLLNGIVLLLVAIISYYLGNNQFFLPLIALSACGGFLLFPWLTRRLCYLSLNSKLAAITGLGHLVVTLASITVISYLNYESWLTALIALSIISFGSGWWILHRLQISVFTWPKLVFMHHVVTSHWQYGRWSLITSILIWIPYNLFYLIVPLWYGIESNAALKAINNLIVPAQQTFAALSVFLLPIFSKKSSFASLDGAVKKLALVFGILSVSYWIFIGIFKQPLLWVIYEGKYMEQSQLLWILGLVPVATGFTAVYGSALRALEKPNYVFVAYLIATIITVTVGISSTYIWNLWGATASLSLSMFSAGSVLIFFYYSKREVR